jgi:hypothetical protein
VAIAAAGGGAVLLIRNSGSDGVRPGSTPGKLALASQNTATRALGAPAYDSGSGSGSTGEPNPLWQLEGTLSGDKPSDGRVRRPSAGSADEAAKLASALGLTGSPTAISGGWALRGPDSTLLILRKDGSWTWSMDCAPDRPLADEDPNVGCASAISSVPPGPPPGPSASDTLTAARPVFTRLGLDADSATATADAGSSNSRSTATVSPAYGWSTTLEVSTDLKVVGGNGWLAGSDEGDAYPLISAADAYKAMSHTSWAMPDLCRLRTDGKPGCADPEPRIVTGATLGLMLDRDSRGALLVPAWLFSIKGATEPAAWNAIDPAYLEPLDSPDDPAPQPGSVEPGSGATDTPLQVDPATPGSEPAPPNSGSGSSGSSGSGTTTADIQSYSLEGDTTIVGWVELSRCETARLSVKEAPDVVYLVAERAPAPVPSGTDCSATDVQQVRAQLQDPLGTRVVRGADGSAIPRRK